VAMTNIPPQPQNSFRIVLELEYPESRMDNVLLNALREQNENEKLKNISRSALKDLFNQKKILIKGQRAKSNSALAKGTTYVDILGF
jgi:23S rRNA-/tRNA-specific pseudouridylate synthase